jgi:hypothetical protein
MERIGPQSQRQGKPAPNAATLGEQDLATVICLSGHKPNQEAKADALQNGDRSARIWHKMV